MLWVRVPLSAPFYKGVNMKKTIGQLYYEHSAYKGIPWRDLSAAAKLCWEKAAKKLSDVFDSVRTNTNCNDEQTDDTSGVPVNAYTQY